MKKFIFILALSATTIVSGQTLQYAQKPKILTQSDVVQKMIYNGKYIDGRGMIVAVLDSGINYLQPQLSGKIAVNNLEIKDDKKDNDLNGFVDDVKGWNFFHKNGIVIDDHGHGTHVSGTIAGNQYGIAPEVKILPVKITVTPEGQVSDRHLIDGIKYSVDNGAKVINLSLRGVYSQMPVTVFALKQAVEYARSKNVLIVVAAGNDSSDITGLPVYPANIVSDNLITVCAVDDQFSLAAFSNYSKTSVDFCAPGVDIASANKNFNPILNPNENAFLLMSGTSMATPIVSGIAALIWSARPELKANQVKNILMRAAKKRSLLTPWLSNSSRTGGVINALESVKELMKEK